MDILKIMATRNNGFGETVVSSLFNYLLDPYADHGFESRFLVRYLKALADKLPWIEERLLLRLEHCTGEGSPDVRVFAEWNDETFEQKRRRIDSVIVLKSGSTAYLIATEVKIYNNSSSDESQLPAYADMLDSLRQSYIDRSSDGFDPAIKNVHCALVYLIPGDSGKGLKLADIAATNCMAKGIDGVIVLPWQMTGAMNVYTGQRSGISMEEMFRELLEENYYGAASPADQSALDIVRSLRNAALKNFDFRYLAGNTRSHQFPDDVSYRNGLEANHLELLDYFKLAAEQILSAKKVTANALHTCIGIPIKANPAKGDYNTLCRVLTVDSYETGAGLDQFVLQLTKLHYEAAKATLDEALQAFPVKARMTSTRDDGTVFFHENGKQNEKVFRIYFAPDSKTLEPQKDAIVAGFARLLDLFKASIELGR
ncbi:hypothetical protein MASR2M48_11650 [Spirochaetota bacterium]